MMSKLCKKGTAIKLLSIVSVVAVISLFILNSFSCSEDGIGITPAIQLTVEDASCTEVWLHLSVSDTVTERTLTLQRNNIDILTLDNVPTDTIIMDKGLLPNQKYTYRIGMKASVTAVTMDTTSHDFTWQIDKLGDASSYFFDVAIVNDTLAYAVGEVFLRNDTTGFIDRQLYGLARWNGHDWTLIRSPYKAFPHSRDRLPGSLICIFAFDEKHIIVGIRNIIMWYDGERWSEQTFLYDRFLDTASGGINKIWGISPEQLWLVGDKGTIFYYNGQTWTKQEKITHLNYRDIWGAYNKKSSAYEILAVGSRHADGPDRIITQLQGQTACSLSTTSIPDALESLWFVPNRQYFVVGAGIFKKNMVHESQWKDESREMYGYYVTGTHGNGINDVFFVSSWGTCMHYNGFTYKEYGNVTSDDGGYTQVRVKGNLVIAVGTDHTRARILVGRR